MKVLVLNSGSSSLKFQLIDTADNKIIAKGMCERIGLEGGLVTCEICEKHKREYDMPDHEEAMNIVFKLLTDKKNNAIKDISEIDIVGHRVVHGGENYSAPILVDEETLSNIEELSNLAPLHNPANAMGIRACMKVMKGVPQVAVFDTAYHQTMPDYVYMYALPYDFYKEYAIRRYGFHGTSHKFVANQAIEMLSEKGIRPEDSKIVTCHLGNGCSMAAIQGGKVLDTTMGLTPVEGLIMGTRCGDVDPAAITYMATIMDYSPKDLDTIMNKRSGLLGISGKSSDMRDIIDAMGEGVKGCELAFKMFVYRVKKYIGSYAAAMNGLDAVIFTGGIGENSAPARAAICKDMDFLGLELDLEANAGFGKADLSKQKNGKILRIPTNEELMIAIESVELINKTK